MKKFKLVDKNQNRERYYGLRIGDIVNKHTHFEEYEVIGYSGVDNNCVYIRTSNGHIIKSTADSLIIKKSV